MQTIQLDSLGKELVHVVNLSGGSLAPSQIELEALDAPHQRPSALPPGAQAIYSFFLMDRCLKVGKAGPKSKARFTSQHYGMNAPSTLAKSILRSPTRLRALLPPGRQAEVEHLSAENIGPWLEQNTSRLHVFVPDRTGPAILNLLEAVLQVRFRPLFEGTTRPAS